MYAISLLLLLLFDNILAAVQIINKYKIENVKN